MSFDGPMKIHIPEPYWNISNFRATLGHKVNHSFRYMKTYYGKVFHPRFGIIRSVVAQEDIKRGEEIFVNYGYRIGGNVPTWVSDLYLHETGKDWYAPKKEKNTISLTICWKHIDFHLVGDLQNFEVSYLSETFLGKPE